MFPVFPRTSQWRGKNHKKTSSTPGAQRPFVARLVNMNTNVALVLAAGKGTRMKSDLPKVLIEVCGRPMIEYVLDALFAGGVQRAIIVVFHSRALLGALGDLRPNNRQGEYYITDVPGLLASRGKEVRAVPILKPCEVLGINTLDELAIVEQEMQRSQNPILSRP